jgi:flagellar hook-length control protein FliK
MQLANVLDNSPTPISPAGVPSASPKLLKAGGQENLFNQLLDGGLDGNSDAVVPQAPIPALNLPTSKNPNVAKSSEGKTTQSSSGRQTADRAKMIPADLTATVQFAAPISPGLDAMQLAPSLQNLTVKLAFFDPNPTAFPALDVAAAVRGSANSVPTGDAKPGTGITDQPEPLPQKPDSAATSPVCDLVQRQQMDVSPVISSQSDVQPPLTRSTRDANPNRASDPPFKMLSEEFHVPAGAALADPVAVGPLPIAVPRTSLSAIEQGADSVRTSSGNDALPQSDLLATVLKAPAIDRTPVQVGSKPSSNAQILTGTQSNPIKDEALVTAVAKVSVRSHTDQDSSRPAPAPQAESSMGKTAPPTDSTPTDPAKPQLFPPEEIKVAPVAISTLSNGTLPLTKSPAEPSEPTPSAGSKHALEIPTSPVVTDAQLLQSSTHTEMRIALQTDKMGSIELRAHLAGEQLGATITVEKRDAHNALAIELPSLQQALSEKHLRIEQVLLSHGSVSSPSQESLGNPQPQHQGSSPGTSPRPNSTPQTLPGGIPVFRSLPTVFDQPGIFDSRGRLSVHV